jgi:hypothetical protein
LIWAAEVKSSRLAVRMEGASAGSCGFAESGAWAAQKRAFGVRGRETAAAAVGIEKDATSRVVEEAGFRG